MGAGIEGVIMFIILIIFLVIPAFIIFSKDTEDAKRYFLNYIRFLTEIVFIIIFPLIYLTIADGATNDCCNDSASFAPGHKLSIYVLIGLSVVAYFISVYRSGFISPIIDIVLNVWLIIGSILCVVLIFHTAPNIAIFVALYIPILILFAMALHKNFSIVSKYAEETGFTPKNKTEKLAWEILTFESRLTFLIVLCFPMLFLIAAILILFGQKPDSMISAFTDTYKHGFSQLDYMCENVECGGHFLCSVAANGHKEVVKPERYGQRLGKPIICNRQLLVANAFEDLVWQKVPRLHKVIRHNYNKVGDVVHKYYGIFNNKYVADAIYLLMKPLQWVFILTLYTFDKNPENRIAVQYLKPEDRKVIDEYRGV